MLILGLIYSEYSKLSNYLQTFDDKLDTESIKKFIELATDLFINRYDSLVKFDMRHIRIMRKRFYESCYPTS